MTLLAFACALAVGGGYVIAETSYYYFYFIYHRNGENIAYPD